MAIRVCSGRREEVVHRWRLLRRLSLAPDYRFRFLELALPPYLLAFALNPHCPFVLLAPHPSSRPGEHASVRKDNMRQQSESRLSTKAVVDDIHCHLTGELTRY